MSTWNVTEADRDSSGQIALDAPRKLADLLPGVEPAKAQPTRPLTRPQIGALAGVALILIAALVALLAQAAPAASVPDPTMAPTFAPSMTPAPTTVGLPRAVVAYAAPDGAVVGAIEAGRPYTLTARYGDAWIQMDAEGSGLIWLRAMDAPDVNHGSLPNLVPTSVPPTAAPTTAAPAAVPAPCDEYTAPHRVERQVEYDGIPIGRVAAWSCKSAADAEQQASEREADIRATYEATR